ncbi:peptide deformylase [Marivibrio halodurans]|uniref:Peptide deformylase n=1 Tax=Marivibrio halodurans TaxID=2039722 RepID=A0A8J7V3W5_9PROT|nr:peptide deformylase [Marivibrio halodurans]MBP5857044.1 peptide deformylase [Marivibrio halodurans]
MAILKIARMGHPVLRRVADPVADPRAADIAALVRDMVATMADADGTGLAAPQVHVPLRVVVYFVEASRRRGVVDPVPLTALINPVVTPLGDDIAYDWEGCLSVPGLVGLVPRATWVRLDAQTPEGERIEREVAGFHARVLQHECDHLDGILYPQRMDDLSLLMFADEMRHGPPEKARRLMGLPEAAAPGTPDAGTEPRDEGETDAA